VTIYAAAFKPDHFFTFMNLLQKSIFSFLGLGCLMAAPLQADVNSDLAFSNFTNVDLNALAGGTILQVKGGLVYFQRGIITQSLYVVDASPTDVQNKLVHWNPADHSELKVWFHKSVPANPKPADFASLADLPDNSSIKFLFDSTAKFDANNPPLQVSKAEAQMIAATPAGDSKTRFINIWSQVLSDRFASFLGGRLASDTYFSPAGSSQPIDDIRKLIHSDPSVYIEFQRLFNQTPIRAGGAAKNLPANLYFQSFDIQGAATLVDGAMYQAANGPTIQSCDIDFYVNYGVYATIELEQLWPVTINGKTETLVWRDDLVSAPSVAYLHGTERLASGMIMLQDVKQNIEAFKSEFK
jgi:hypothetical protein